MRGERQRHGFQFEDWLKKQFFDIFYTSKWDVPGELNPQHPGVPISIKTAKWQSGVGFGDALRQFNVHEPFDLVVAFWEVSKGKKKIVKITETLISKKAWRGYWGGLQLEDLQGLDKLIKNRKMGYQKVRVKAKAYKKKAESKCGIMTLNPKIDSKDQRRLQCSISFGDFFEEVIGDSNPDKDRELVLWGKIIKPPPLD